MKAGASASAGAGAGAGAGAAPAPALEPIRAERSRAKPDPALDPALDPIPVGKRIPLISNGSAP